MPTAARTDTGISPELIERLRTASRLPTPPAVVVRLLALTHQRDVSSRDIAETIATDPALAAKILRFVNSPLAGVTCQVTSLSQAVALIGVRGVTTMALSIATISSSRAITCDSFCHETFAARSLACGVAAKTLAKATKMNCAQEAFVAGLLSQIGRLTLASVSPEAYAETLASTQHAPRELPDRERARLGGTYPEVGAWLLRNWGIPETLCGAVEDFRSVKVDAESGALARILYVSELIGETICPDKGCDPPSSETTLSAAEHVLALGVDDCLAAIRESAEAIEHLRSLFDLPASAMRNIEDLEADVHERIAELSVAMHLENQSLVGQKEELMRRATTDALTGVGNRAAFDARMSLELERAARSGAPFGLLMIDIDRFKDLNDTYGHQAGDRMLQAVAELFEHNVRRVDYVARYGGEEFAIIAPDSTCEGLAYLGERMRQMVEQLIVRWDSKSLGVTISVGAALFTDIRDTDDATRVIRAADAKLYAAKCNGRNRVEVAIDGEPQRRQTTPG